MKNSMKKAALATTILLTSAMATSAFAWGGKDHDDRDRRGNDDDRGRMEQRDEMGRGGMMGGFDERMADRLAYELVLDADTKEKVKTLFANAGDEMKSIREQMRDLHKANRDVKPSDENYIATVTANAQKGSELHVQAMAKMAETQKALYALLTPEQIAKLEQIQENGMMHGKRGGKHH